MQRASYAHAPATVRWVRRIALFIDIVVVVTQMERRLVLVDLQQPLIAQRVETMVSALALVLVGKGVAILPACAQIGRPPGLVFRPFEMSMRRWTSLPAGAAIGRTLSSSHSWRVRAHVCDKRLSCRSSSAKIHTFALRCEAATRSGRSNGSAGATVGSGQRGAHRPLSGSQPSLYLGRLL